MSYSKFSSLENFLDISFKKNCKQSTRVNETFFFFLNQAEKKNIFLDFFPTCWYRAKIILGFIYIYSYTKKMKLGACAALRDGGCVLRELQSLAALHHNCTAPSSHHHHKGKLHQLLRPVGTSFSKSETKGHTTRPLQRCGLPSPWTAIWLDLNPGLNFTGTPGRLYPHPDDRG